MHGVAGMLIADGLSKAMADKRYMLTIETPTGESITEMSMFDFPVGSCVSIGSNETAHKGTVAKSKRCGQKR